MKRSQKTALVAAMFASAVTLASCGPDASSEDTSNTKPPAAVTSESAAEYDPESEEPQDVYGPPEFFDDSTEPEVYTPSEDEVPAVYGPPEFFDSTYDPEDDDPQDVYGPPPEDLN